MSDNDKVYLLAPHVNMTPKEALSYALKEDWEDVIIIGYHKDRDGLVSRSSNMSRQEALWIIEFAKRQAMGLDE